MGESTPSYGSLIIVDLSTYDSVIYRLFPCFIVVLSFFFLLLSF